MGGDRFAVVYEQGNALVYVYTDEGPAWLDSERKALALAEKQALRCPDKAFFVVKAQSVSALPKTPPITTRL